MFCLYEYETLSLHSLLGASWGPPGSSGGLLVASQQRFGTFWELLEVLLGGLGVPLGAVWQNMGDAQAPSRPRAPAARPRHVAPNGHKSARGCP